MRNLRIGLMATGALMGCVGLVDTGNAQAIYGGGATFPAPVYRYLFDCWHTPVDGNPPAGGPTGFLAPFPIAPACPNPAGNASGVLAQILYAPVGSGGGKRAIKNHDCSSAATGLGTPAAANAVPYVSSQLPAYGYPSCHFAGSDDTWNAADAADWVTKGNPAKYGLLLQLPAFAGPVTIPFNGNDGTGAPLNIVNPIPAGGSSGLNLSRKALCGIFSGHITQWSNPTLTALNGGVPLGAGPITVVHRSDGSGTTFLFAQAMFAQCVGEFGPNSESDPTITSWAFPWSDRSVGAGPCPALIYRAANALNWEDLGTNQCGASIPAVPGAFAAGSGNAGVVSAVQATNGAIGYSTTDFTQPIVPTGPKNANLQSQYDLDNATGLFQPPTDTAAETAIASAIPRFDSTSRINPLNWSTQAVVPNPILPGSYPIVGFTFLNLYQCYDPAPGTLNGIFSYLTFHYGNAAAKTIMRSQGFAPVTDAWFNEIVALVTTGSSAMGAAGGGACAGVGPGA